MFSKLTQKSDEKASNLIKDLDLIQQYVLLGIYRLPHRGISRLVSIKNEVIITNESEIRSVIPDGCPEFDIADIVDRLYAEGLLTKFPGKNETRYEPSYEGELAALYIGDLDERVNPSHKTNA